MLRRLLPFILVVVVAVVLRSALVSSVPISPYWEETILGVDAYSLSQTGKDHHGNAWPIVALESFGDWKPAGYVYAVLPFVWTFGLELWVVRLPSLLAGIAIVIAVALIGRRISLPLWLSAMVAAVAPWAIHFSRAAWEANLATALIAWAVVCVLAAIEKHRLKLLPTVMIVILLSLAWYTYHAARVVVPLLALGILLYFLFELGSLSSVKKCIRQSWIAILAGILLVAVFVFPILQQRNAAALTQRFNETGRFSDQSIVLSSNALKDAADNTAVSRLLYHRYVLWGADILDGYFDNLNPAFLFIAGESNLRHTTSYFGLFYVFEVVFLLVGIYSWITKRNSVHYLLLYWLLISILPAALATPTPHALRILIGLPVFALLIAEGINAILSYLKHKLPKKFQAAPVVAIVALYVVAVSAFFYNYNTVYAKTSSSQWQYGYRQLFEALAVTEAQDPAVPVYISRSIGRPASYLWFYRKTDPRLIQAANESVARDQGEYLEFETYHFFRSIGEIPAGGAVVALTPAEYSQLPESSALEKLVEIRSESDEVIWIIGKQ